MNGESSDSVVVDIGKKHKLGHIRVDNQGNTTYKRLPTNELVEALQLGIYHSVGGLEARPARDILIQDFPVIDITHFPKAGSSTPKHTPPHPFNDFTIRAYAPSAFRHFREVFHIKPADYLSSICRPFRELKNPGASGSLFYLTSDDEFIIKTVQKREATFLKSLLPGYYLNLTQNPRTLLPKFFGLYCYQGDNKNIRITVMNNLIPSNVHIHEKYDLKGSTYKRQASSRERQKDSPTWKDLDFVELHPKGLLLDPDTYNALKRTVERDCRVLESFQIMDYSFLIGVHRVDSLGESMGDQTTPSDASADPTSSQARRMMFATPMANIEAEFDESNKPDDYLARTGGIPARTETGQKLSLYVGIIDILQSYQLRKKLEHTFKSVVTDGSQISVTHPRFYSERFQKFLFQNVFIKAPGKPSKAATITDLRPTTHASATNTPSDFSSFTHRSSVPLSTNASNLTYSSSTSSKGTTGSRIDSYYASLRSSRNSSNVNEDGSSTTLYASSHRSDSLLNQPTGMHTAKIITTPFQQQRDHSRMKFYRETSSSSEDKRQNPLPPTGKLSSSTANILSRSNLSDRSARKHRENHQSSDQVTRL